MTCIIVFVFVTAIAIMKRSFVQLLFAYGVLLFFPLYDSMGYPGRYPTL